MRWPEGRMAGSWIKDGGGSQRGAEWESPIGHPAIKSPRRRRDADQGPALNSLPILQPPLAIPSSHSRQLAATRPHSHHRLPIGRPLLSQCVPLLAAAALRMVPLDILDLQVLQLLCLYMHAAW